METEETQTKTQRHLETCTEIYTDTYKDADTETHTH